jgi:hypothetical protein
LTFAISDPDFPTSVFVKRMSLRIYWQPIVSLEGQHGSGIVAVSLQTHAIEIATIATVTNRANF